MIDFRVGFAYDLHRFADEGDHICLGGLRIAHHCGVLAHSDGDVVLHALCDAMLGALALGDIGQLFPDTDPAHHRRDSREFVHEVWQRVSARGYRVNNADIMILLERPKLAAYKTRMAASIAELVHTEPGNISVKATTNEKVDGIGLGQALAAYASVSLRRDS